MQVKILHRPLLWKGLFAASLVALLILSLLPGSEVEPLFSGQDKLAHALAFSWLFIAGWLAQNRKGSQLWLIILLLGFGLLIEFLQSFTGYRYAELGDILADIAGILLGIFIKVVAGKSSDPNLSS